MEKIKDNLLAILIGVTFAMLTVKFNFLWLGDFAKWFGGMFWRLIIGGLFSLAA